MPDRPPYPDFPHEHAYRRSHHRVIHPIVVLCTFGVVGVVGIALLAGGRAPVADASSSGSRSAARSAITALSPDASTFGGSASPSASTPSPLASTPSPSATPGPTQTEPVNVYAGTGVGMFAPAVAGLPPRVYVPDEQNGTVVVIDPMTFKIIGRFNVGASPEHVTPDWDLRRLYADASFSGRLTIIDPLTGRPIGARHVPSPYNLYFSLDGSKAIVVLDSSVSGTKYSGPKQLYFYDRRTWRLLKALRIPWAGADHLDFSADGKFFLLSTEYAGYLVKVDVARMAVVKALDIGGKPVDVRLSPDGRLFYVANQGLGGVSIIDPVHMRQLAFLRTGRGAHGLAVSRDARRLYVTNRRAGTLSVIDFARRHVVATWRIGGTPDMIAVSPDGTQLWISNRYGGTVSVVSTVNGRVIATIRTGGRPHGLTYFPEPGSFSIGHNGMYR